MNIGKKILNVLGVIVTIPLSLILVVWLICAPIVSSAATLVNPETMHTVLKSVDYEELLAGSTSDDELVQAVMETRVAAQILEMYVDELYAQVEGEEPGTVLNAVTLKQVIEANIDELVPIMKDMIREEVGDGAEITDEQARTYIMDIVDQEAANMLAEIPTAESLGLLSPETAMVLEALRSGAVTIAVCIVAAVLSLLIFVFRLYRFRGFVWLSVLYGLATAATLSMYRGMGSASSVVDPELASVVEAFVPVLTSHLLWSTIICGVVMAACIAGAILCSRALHAPKLSAEPVAAAEPDQPWER